jgi:FHA domain-containing protein
MLAARVSLVLAPDGPECTCPECTCPSAACAWTAIVAADRAYYDAVVARADPTRGRVIFPPYCPPRSHPFGCADPHRAHSASRASLPRSTWLARPEDPGVSHLHAMLLAQPDGTWVLVDPGSTNGTCLNDDPEPIGVNVPVPVRDGDRIHIGA